MKFFRNVLWVFVGCSVVLLITALNLDRYPKLFANILLVYFNLVNFILLATIILIVCKKIKHMRVKINEVILLIFSVLLCIPIDWFVILLAGSV